MKKELKNILVPVDFNEPSVKAVQYAYNLALKLKADLILLHVLQANGLISDFLSKGDHLIKMTDQAKDKLSEIVNSIEKKGEINITTKVERGKPYDVIIKTTDHYSVRMIILGENHQGEGVNQELGSTVYHVTLKSPVPVLTLKGNISEMHNSIVVPLDLTSQMRKQLFSTIVYGLNYNAKVHLVSALIGGIKMHESRIFKKLKQAKQTLIDNGVEATVKLFPRTTEPPFRQILNYANDIDAGMILLMTHKEGYTYDNYIGAFAHHIINKSKVPVLSLTAASVDDVFTKVLNAFLDPAKLLSK
jgi:nucleotide-binding universal stress UspA family protein